MPNKAKKGHQKKSSTSQENTKNSWGSFGSGGENEVSINKLLGVSPEEMSVSAKEFEEQFKKLEQTKPPADQNSAELERIQATIKGAERFTNSLLSLTLGLNQAIFNLGNLGLSGAPTTSEISSQKTAPNALDDALEEPETLNLGNLDSTTASANQKILGPETAVANSAQTLNALTPSALDAESLPSKEQYTQEYLASELKLIKLALDRFEPESDWTKQPLDHDSELKREKQNELEMISKIKEKRELVAKMISLNTGHEVLKQIEDLKAFSADPEWPQINDLPKSFHPTINQLPKSARDKLNSSFIKFAQFFRKGILLNKISETIDNHKDCFSFEGLNPEGFEEKTLDEFKILFQFSAISSDETSAKKILDLLKEDFHVIFSQADDSYFRCREDGKFAIAAKIIGEEIFIDQGCAGNILEEIQKRKLLTAGMAQKETLLPEHALDESDLSESAINKLILEMRKTMPTLTYEEIIEGLTRLEEQLDDKWKKTPPEQQQPSAQYVKDAVKFFKRERILSDASIISNEGISFLKPNPNNFEKKAIDALKAALYYAITKEFLDKEDFNFNATREFITTQFKENFKIIISQSEIEPAKRGENGEFFVLAKEVGKEIFIHPNDIRIILRIIQQKELSSSKEPSTELKKPKVTRLKLEKSNEI